MATSTVTRACIQCNQLFPARTYQFKIGTGKYCSTRCYADARAGSTLTFWFRVAMPTDGCWEWQGGRQHQGYGQFRIRERTQAAHRVAWEMSYGPIPKGMVVCHKCDNPPCCRPDHLFLGTTRDNQRDKWAKGRGSAYRGVTNASAKLTADEVRKLRSLAASGRYSLTALARMFGITRNAVTKAVRRISYADIE